MLRFNRDTKRRKDHGKENPEEGKEAGSNEATDDRWPAQSVIRRSASQVHLSKLQTRRAKINMEFRGLPPKGGQPFLLTEAFFPRVCFGCLNAGPSSALVFASSISRSFLGQPQLLVELFNGIVRN
jgi:hypothetical protein